MLLLGGAGSRDAGRGRVLPASGSVARSRWRWLSKSVVLLLAERVRRDAGRGRVLPASGSAARSRWRWLSKSVVLLLGGAGSRDAGSGQGSPGVRVGGEIAMAMAVEECRADARRSGFPRWIRMSGSGVRVGGEIAMAMAVEECRADARRSGFPRWRNGSMGIARRRFSPMLAGSSAFPRRAGRVGTERSRRDSYRSLSSILI